jgi:hypothetical protein
MSAVIAGASLGLLALFIEYNPSDVALVLNPLEEMMTFADASAVSVVDNGNLSLMPLPWCDLPAKR